MKNSGSDHDFALTNVADDQKRGFWSMFVIMMGFTFFSASMLAGGKLGNGMSFSGFITAVIAGNVILGIYTSLLAHISSRTGLSVHLLSGYSFGEYGRILPDALLIFTQVGWFGVGVAMFAIPTAMAIMEIPSLSGSWMLSGPVTQISFDGVQIPSRLLWTLVLCSGLLMTSTAYWGIRALSAISFVAVPAIAVFGCYSAVRAMFFDAVPQEIAAKAATPDAITNGWSVMKSFIPSDAAKLTMAQAVSIAIGSFISGGSCTPDFARFSKNSKIAVSTTALAFFIGNSLMFFFGAAGAMVYGQSDISLVLKLQGLLLPAVVVLGLNIWTTNDNALYTSGLGLSNLTKLPKKYLVLFNGAIGTLAAVWLYDNFVGWLNFLNSCIPPIGAILIADYFIVRRGKYENISAPKFRSVSPFAVIGWAAGSAVGLLAMKFECMNVGLPAVNAMIATIVVYLAGTFASSPGKGARA